MSDISEATSALYEHSLSVGASEEPSPLHRLFVGSVPRTAVEATLRGYFEQCGVVRDLAILRDRSSGKSRGCAFVSYLALEEAEEAIQKFDRQLVLSGSETPLEVRFAKNHSYVQAGNGPSGNRTLFFSRAPLNQKEEEIWALFEAYGEIENINIFKCRRSGRSKGCGFVEMQSREAAIVAMENLDEQHVFEATGTAISVRWADPELQQRKKKAMDDANADNRMLFFAKVLRSTIEDDVRCLFSSFGKVHDINLFRAFQGAPTTKGCGLVTMSQHAEAVAAITALDGKHVWEGMDCPMVVKWMDTALQRRRREQHLANIRQPPLPPASIEGALSGQQRPPAQLPFQLAHRASIPAVLQLGGSTAVADPCSSGAPLVGASGPTTAATAVPAPLVSPTTLPASALAPLDSSGSGGVSALGSLTAFQAGDSLDAALEKPPSGCNPDVIKLFVGNIPKNFTEERLLPLFQSIGKVVELVILYDKVTQESKGSAFVWYATREDAERAILQFNLRHVSPDPPGPQDRPLVVRRAKARSSRIVMAPLTGLLGAATLGQEQLRACSHSSNRLQHCHTGACYYQCINTEGYNPCHATLFQGTPAGFGTASYQGLVNLGGVGKSGATGGVTLASLPAGIEGLQLLDGSAVSMGSMGIGMGMSMEVGIGGGPQMAAVTGAPHSSGFLAGGQVMVIGGGHTSGASLGGSGGSGRGMPGIITLATEGMQSAGLYDTYGTGDSLLADFGTAAIVPSNQAATAAALTGGPDGGGYAVVHSGSLGRATSHWDAAAAAVAARLASGAADAGATAFAYAAASSFSTALCIALTPTQLQSVNQHLYSIQTISGATLQLSAGPAGMFQLHLSGTREQVEAARHLATTVLGGGV